MNAESSSRALLLLLEGNYRMERMPGGVWRVHKPGRLEPYVVDPTDGRRPCTCPAGMHGRHCKHLDGVLALMALDYKEGTDG